MSLSQSFSQKIGNVRPLNPCPSLDIDFANGGYVNTGGFANQASVGSANFKIGAFNGPDPIFTRATAATFRGSDGLIQYAPENLIPNSESFDAGTWTKGNLNITGTPSWINVATAPNGLNVADCIFANSTLSSHYIRYVGLSGIQSNPVTFSVFLKKNGYDLAMVSVQSLTSNFEQFRIYANLLTGSYSSTAFGGAVFITASVDDVGNGWFRCSVTGSLGTKGDPTPSVSILESSGAISFSGDPTKGIYIWGAQLERSSTARPYISTTALPVYGPRFEYDLSGNPLGLLMEEQSQNLVYPSSTLTTQTRTVTAAPHTLSFYGTGSVSLSGATIGTVIGSGANTRTVYTFTPTAGSLTLTVSGSVTLAQLEQKPFATSYIPTVGGPMTRNADVVNSTIGSWFNADEGTIVVKGDRTGFNIQDSLFEFTSGTTASLAHRGDGTDENFLVEDAATTVTIVETIPLNSPLYFAASYSALATQVNATVNAEPVQGTSLASTITTPTTLNIAYSPEISTYFNGHIKAFRYYAKALPSKLEFFTLTT